MADNLAISDRAKGALLGFAIGDALGWPQERLDLRLGRESRIQKNPAVGFIQWERRSGGRFRGYHELIERGEYSDDTQLMLSTARSLLKGPGWNEYMEKQELPLWQLYMRGAGRAAMAAAASWQSNTAPWMKSTLVSRYFATGANGAAMRILPHAIMCNTSYETMHKEVVQNGILTHGHPRALLGAKLYAHAARHLLTLSRTLNYGSLIDFLLDQVEEWSVFPVLGNDYVPWNSAAEKHFGVPYSDAWNATVLELVDGLQICRKELERGSLSVTNDFLRKIGGFERKSNGSGVVAALASIYSISRYATNPVSGMLELAFAYGSDTDTLTAMAGGLFGALLGLSWIPEEWRIVQDHDYLLSLGKALSLSHAEKPLEIESVKLWSLHESMELLAILQSKSVETLAFGGLGIAIVEKSQNARQLVKSVKPDFWKLKLEFGQSIYIPILTPLQRTSEEETSSNAHRNEPKSRQVRPKISTISPPSPRQLQIAAKTCWSELFEAKPADMATTYFVKLISLVLSIIQEDLSLQGFDGFRKRMSDSDYPGLVANELQDEHVGISEEAVISVVRIMGAVLLAEAHHQELER